MFPQVAPAVFGFACAATLAASAIVPSLAASGEQNLPDIGSSASQVLSPEMLKAYGEQTLQEMRRQNLVLDDPLLEDWLQEVGDRVGANSNRPSQEFRFFIVRDRDINAFATFGGYVAVNAGLIEATTSEDELAAVLSHEIAHVTQNHLLRAVEEQKKDTLPIVLAMLAAVIATSKSNSTSADNATEAVLAAGSGLMQQMQINFTRDNETEADHIGIQTLARAGYDPAAMASFFGRLQAAYRSDEGYGPYKTPDFLQDHPVTTTRISDALDRARQIQARPELALPNRIDNAPDSLLLPAPLKARLAVSSVGRQHGRDYGWAHERVRVLSAESSGTALAEYQRMRANDPKSFGDPQRYGLAVAMIAHGDAAAALPDLQELSKRHPSAYWIDLAIGYAQFASGQRQSAMDTYERLLRQRPYSRAVILSYAKTLGEVGTREAGRRAQVVLRTLATDDEDDPEFQQAYGRACELAGDIGRAGESYAAAAFLNGRAEDALNQLEALKRRDDIDYYQRARIDALIAQVTPIVLELHKRGVHAGDQDRKGQQQLSRTSLH
jgi:predicted Zn-dependent protease